MFCTNCNTENEDNAKFCKKCGNTLSSNNTKNLESSKRVNENHKDSNNSSIKKSKFPLLALICIIIVILVAGACIFFITTTKEDCKLTITNEKLYVDDSLIIKLTDSKDNPIPNKLININLTDEEKTVKSQEITTNNNGEAQIKMEKEGKYYIESTFNGDDHYSTNSTTANINVEKRTINTDITPTSTNPSSKTGLSEDGYSYYPEYGPTVDALGYTQEEAIAKNWHYIPQTIDGRDAGIYVPYDPVAGCYHT